MGNNGIQVSHLLAFVVGALFTIIVTIPMMKIEKKPLPTKQPQTTGQFMDHMVNRLIMVEENKRKLQIQEQKIIFLENWAMGKDSGFIPFIPPGGKQK